MLKKQADERAGLVLLFLSHIMDAKTVKSFIYNCWSDDKNIKKIKIILAYAAYNDV